MTEIDEIMAEYLLKGGKMLAKTCSVCQAPLFEYKGERFCVLCTESSGREGETLATVEQNQAATEDTIKKPPARVLPIDPEPAAASVSGRRQYEPQEAPSMLAGSIEDALIALCRRMADEPDPARCAVYMQTIREGVSAMMALRGEHCCCHERE